MKNLLKAFMIPVIMFTFVICCGLSVSANDEVDYDFDAPTPFNGIGIINGKVRTYEYMFIWNKTILNENFTIEKGQHLRIEPIGYDPTDGRVIVNNGAVANIKGDIFIEQNGVLEIEDGTVVINGGNITNCGTIKIGKNGTLKVLSGTLNSTAAGSIQNEGKITCLTSGKKLDTYFKSIKKFDDHFNLSDYSLLIESDGNSASVTTNYCINDIMTNYKYKFDIDKSVKKVKIVRSNYSLETVYNSKTAQKLQERVSSFKNSHTKELNFNIVWNSWKDCGYTYNYKSNELVYNAKWFSYDDMNEKFIENEYSEKA